MRIILGLIFIIINYLIVAFCILFNVHRKIFTSVFDFNYFNSDRLWIDDLIRFYYVTMKKKDQIIKLKEDNENHK
jgi:hypothetical protein